METLENEREIWQLQQMQGLPLNMKIRLTRSRIRDWVNHWGEDKVYVSFSGGKDSTVLLDLVNQDYPDIPAVFVDVPTQYPELKSFAKEFCEKRNIKLEILKPKTNFMQVCEKYGFPIISKEVSGCVYESKKWLDKVEKMKTALTDRQTDRQTDSKECPCNSRSIGYRQTNRQEQRTVSNVEKGNYP